MYPHNRSYGLAPFRYREEELVPAGPLARDAFEMHVFMPDILLVDGPVELAQEFFGPIILSARL